MFWWSDSHETKGASQIICDFLLIENKAKTVMEHCNHFIIGFSFFIKITTIIFLIAVVFSQTLRYLFHDRLFKKKKKKRANFFHTATKC